LQQRAEEIRSFGSSYDVAATHLVADKLVNNGMTQLDAHRLIDNPVRANIEDRYLLNQARTAVRSELMYKVSPINNTGDKAVSFAESSQGHSSNMMSLEHKAKDQIADASNNSTAKVQQTASNDGVSQKIVGEEIEQSKNDANNKFKNTQAENQELSKNIQNANQTKLEKAENEAVNAQPLQRAKNLGNSIVNAVTPSKGKSHGIFIFYEKRFQRASFARG
jgi:hypothetical protein